MLKKKEELLQKIDCIYESIKDIDTLRSQISNGKIKKNIQKKNTYVKSLY